MEILKSLGVNWTLWIQLACFLISYFLFSQLILKPYVAAAKEREKRTIGNEEHAARLLEETNDLQHSYEQKARAINSKLKAYFDHTRAEAVKDQERLLEQARAEANRLLEQARATITAQIEESKVTLLKEVPSVGAVIASQLAGKEISA